MAGKEKMSKAVERHNRRKAKGELAGKAVHKHNPNTRGKNVNNVVVKGQEVDHGPKYQAVEIDGHLFPINRNSLIPEDKQIAMWKLTLGQ